MSEREKRATAPGEPAEAETGQSLRELLDVLDLEPIEVNIFRGRSPDGGPQRIFGGQVAGQALVAAGRTVPEDRFVHSLHAYFIRPGDPSVPIVYEVDRVRDGRSFTTRRVTAIQHGKAIFTLSASFHHVEPGLSHQMPMPEVPAPEELPTMRDRLFHAFGKVPRFATWHPIEMRPVGPLSFEVQQDRSLSSTENLVWLKVGGRLPDDPLLQVCLMTYASDMTLLDTVLIAHGRSFSGISMASLDHAMWFHRPFRADEWLLYAQETPVSHGARGLARGLVYTRSGELVCSVVQEGLIRVLDEEDGS
ncbi:acyl-CoA thioesterase II [Actinorugispora endophytica]|uniref:Acyl-CoA thioesterase 2 n=1 Tax=Actinorugispora endophytica TaxID=1605990 RepID=A0A4R6V6K5_9ACTN|nr:acyl-CoA thioesterase II [Actinorugispora endophytica]TDQ54719.1 acyl-CoA thioesterase-2 [Actinorugispora endophytica]